MAEGPRPLPSSPHNIERALTEDLDGRNDELARQEHAETRSEPRLAGKDLLEGVHEHMREGCGDERAVRGHLERLARHLRARQEVDEERRVLGDARRGRACEVRGEDLLQELQEGFAHGR